MRKLFSFMLMATALLISGNLWAQNTCKIGTTEYPSFKDAVAAVPTNGVSTTIEMIADEIIAEIGKNYVTIASGQNIILDLKGFLLQGTSTCVNDNTCLIKIAGASNGLGFATLIIQDTEAPSDPKLGTGKICYIHNATDNTYNFGNSTILNYGTCIVKSGIVALETPAEYEDIADYVIDLDMRVGYGSPIVGTIEGGYIYSTLECFRCYGSSKTSLVTLNLKGGEYFGASGIIFTQASAGTSLQINVTDGKFICDNDDMALVRVYVSNPDESANQSINISGGIANVDAIRIQISTKQKDIIENVRQNTESHLADVFNITGGTFASENYQIKCTHIDNQYQTVEVTNVSDYILPTLLDGATLKDESTNKLEPGVAEEDRTYPDEITIVPLGAPVVPTNKNDLITQSDDDHATTINTTITLEDGDVVKPYHLTVANGGVLTIPDGAVVKTGKGGVKVEQGGRINVQAGGTLIVGAYGCATEQINSIYAYSTAEKDAIIMFSPEALLRQNPQIVVKMASPARKEAATESYWWQAFGIPTTGNPNLGWSTAVQTQFFSYGTNDWVPLGSKNQVNKPFTGYLLRNDAATAGTVYEMYGDLNSKEDATVSLTHSGWNFFANSYMAPMDLKSFFEHCYSGSGHDNGDIDGSVTIYDPIAPGYIPYSITEIMDGDDNVISSIAPMQAFFLFSNTSSQIDFKFKYEECVWEPFMAANSANAPRRSSASSTKLNIIVAAGEMKDQIKLYEADKFSAYYDNGADARKMMNPTFNIYANIDGIDAAIVASDNLNGTQLAFQAGDAVEYTMTFSNRNNDNFVLVDNANGAQVAMTEGATYTFVATPNSTDANRFEIRKITSVVTGNEDAVVDGRKDGTYLVKDHLVIVKNGKAFNVLGL